MAAGAGGAGAEAEAAAEAVLAGGVVGKRRNEANAIIEGIHSEVILRRAWGVYK